jgi:hypothetical protein
MRTTINLREDVHRAASAAANLKGLSSGEALAELVRRGLKTLIMIDTDKAFPCFVLPPDAEPITLERTLAVEDEL